MHHLWGSKHTKPTCWLGECLCRHQWRQRFIWDQIFLRSWKSTRTRTSKSFRICSTSPRSWYTSNARFWMWEWLNVHLVHGRDPRWLMIRRTCGQRQKYEFIQIQSYGWEKWQNLWMQIEDGKVKWKNFNKLILTKNNLQLMENRLSSSGIFSPGRTSLEFLRKTQKDLQERNIEPENFESSCRCSMILIGREEEIQNSVFQIPNKSRTTRRNSRRSTGHSLDLEAKRSGMENQITILKGNDKTQPTWWWNTSRNLDIHYSKVFLRRGFLRKKKQQGDHAPPCGCFEHRAFVFHSANQLCIYGAVARWCEDFGMKSDETPPKTSNDKILKEVRPEEMTSLVEAPRNAQPAAGNSLRGFQQNFETLVTKVQITRICEEMAVAVGRFHRTALDVDDGFGDRTLCMYREHTSPRAESDSRIFAAIKQRTIVGPVLQVHIIKRLGIYGIEIQILSTISPKKTSLGCHVSRTQPLRGRVTSSRARTRSHQFGITTREPLQRKPTLLLRRWTNPASRKFMRCRNLFLRLPCALWKTLFLRRATFTTKTRRWPRTLHSCRRKSTHGTRTS